MENDQRLTQLPSHHTELQTESHGYVGGYSSFYDDEASEGKRNLRQYFNIVYKRLPIILAITLLATAAAAFYMYRQPSVFQASTEMLIEPRKPRVQSKDSININLGYDAKYYQTQLQLLQSPDLMKKVVVALGLYNDPDLFDQDNRGIVSTFQSIFSSAKKPGEAENSLPILSEDSLVTDSDQPVQLTPEESSRAEQYAAVLAYGLTVEQLEQTNLVTLGVKSTQPALAAKVSDKVAEVFIVEDAERETQGAKNAFEDLSKSIVDLKDTIANQEADLMSYMRSSNLPLQEKGQDLLAGRLQTLSSQWLTAMDDRRKIEARYNAAVQASSRGEGMNLPDLYENRVFQDTMRLNTERKAKLQDQIREIDKEIQKTESEKAELLVKYTTEYSKVKEKQERIASLTAIKEKTEKEVTGIIERDEKKIEKDAVSGALVGLRSQLDSSKKRESQLLASYEREAAAANVQGQAETRLTTLKREIETGRNLLDTYTQRQKEQELAIASGRPDNIKISNHSITPTFPVGPQRNRNIMVVFLLSLSAGVGLAFLLDYLDDSIKTSDDIGRGLGLPTLALIPHHAGTTKPRLGLASAAFEGAGPSTGLITLAERNSPMAEAYRHLRTSLLFSSAGRPPQTILITSSQPSEGKTTTAINAAITLAQADADVVVIDCDLRRPRIHSYFDLENSHGLTNFLSGEEANEAALLKPSRDLPRLKVITSGPIPPNPAELLSSSEMKNLLTYLRANFKHVIIDSPPAISFTDAAILSTIVDGVVIVAMAGKSSVHLLRRFKQRLGAIGVRIYGVVLNGIKSGSTEYEYYGSGYYNYYSKSRADSATPMMEDRASVHETKG
ncbi:MAG: polysaccharide biosynthesis tyrosine autokinase [Pyrinomonadaceae bacterium]